MSVCLFVCFLTSTAFSQDRVVNGHIVKRFSGIKKIVEIVAIYFAFDASNNQFNYKSKKILVNTAVLSRQMM